MTTKEFSDEFDVLFNSITSNQAPGLDEYEKSVFLTQAQEDIIEGYFNAKKNKIQEGYDDSKKRQIDFSSLVKTVKLSKTEAPEEKLDDRSVCYPIPEDLFIYINEVCKDKNTRYSVIPISNTEYDLVMTKPYQYPIKRGVWRLITVGSPSIASVVKDILIGNNPKIPAYRRLTLTNKSSKDVTFIYNFKKRPISDASEAPGKAPVMKEDNNRVTIECVVYTDSNDGVNYLEAFYDEIGELKEYIGSFPRIPGETVAYKKYPGWAHYYSMEIPPEGTKYTINVPKAPNNQIELIGRFDVDTLEYKVRYLIKPTPIITTSLDGTGLSINGVTDKSNCILPSELHHDILIRAVELAKAAYVGNLSDQVSLGQVSGTELGVVTRSQ